MLVKEKSIILTKETGALRGAEIEFYTEINNITGIKEDKIILKVKNDNYSKYTAPVNYIIDCLLIPGIKEIMEVE